MLDVPCFLKDRHCVILWYGGTREVHQGMLVPFEGPGRAEDERAEKMPECLSAPVSEQFEITRRSVGPMSRGSLCDMAFRRKLIAARPPSC